MIGSVLCYVRKDQHVLMLHRVKKVNDFHEGKWNGLGGKMEPGESPEDCLLREIHEESGLTLTEYDMKGILTFPLFDGVNDWLVFLFTADGFEGELQECSEGNLKWIPEEELLDLNLWEGDRYFLNWIEEERPFFSATFEYQSKKLISHKVQFYK